jgi:hypothetical protein
MNRRNILIIIGIIIIACLIIIPDYEGICSDMSMPKNAIMFAYENMEIKHNVTFITIEPNQWEGTCERHYWVTDTEGIHYRLVWSKMHKDIRLNTPYTIHYLKGLMNPIWECEPENSS